MPPPPSRRYATPASEFGIAKPVNEWFDFAAAGSPQTGPSFSRGLDEADTRATQRELEQLKLQRELRSERALDNFLTQAAGQNPRGLMQLIQDSPDLLTNEQAPGIQDYVQSQLERQKAMRAEKEPFSTKVLAPSIVKNLTADQQVKFYRNVNSGMPVADAFDATMEQDRLEKMQMKAAENDLMMQRLGASRSRTGTGTSSASRFKQDDLEKADNYLLNLEEQGIAKDDPRYVRALARRNAIEMALDEDIFGAPAIPNQATPGGATAAAGAATTEPKVAAPTLPPAPPATAEEEAALKEQQKRGVTQEQRQQLADAAWTGLKGTVASENLSNRQRVFPTKHPLSKNTDGTSSNIVMAGVNLNGKEYVIPTMVNGKQLDIDAAVKIAREKGFDKYPSFNSVEEADAFAQKNHSLIDENGYLMSADAPRGVTAAPDVISEARKAIVGGETTNKRAQRIAALARAYADGRNVKVGTAVAGGLASGFSEEIDTFASPAEALVRELGYEPDAIVGQAPSSPGGPLRDVTALEAANAILADTAVPFLELKRGVEVATGDSEEDPLIEAALEKARTGKLKKD
jgi:hypothetical protein